MKVKHSVVFHMGKNLTVRWLFLNETTHEKALRTVLGTWQGLPNVSCCYSHHTGRNVPTSFLLPCRREQAALHISPSTLLFVSLSPGGTVGGRQVFPLTHSHGMWLFTWKREVWASRAGLGTAKGRQRSQNWRRWTVSGWWKDRAESSRKTKPWGTRHRCPPIDAASLS